jgi:thiamine-monophosphate kinase
VHPVAEPGAGTSSTGTGQSGGPLLRDLGEDALLAQVFPLLPAGSATLLGPGDDAAVVAAPDGRVVVSTDVLVEGRHFRRDRTTARDVGRRAAAQNVADIAAMGAVPTAVVVGLVAPGDLPVAWVLDLARGLSDVLGRWGASVVGGDLSNGAEVVVAVTVHGDLQHRDPVTRGGARPGDVIALAGRCGWSAAGLALLDAGAAGEETAPLVRAHHVPEPPVPAGAAAAAAGATAMLDVSDGLVRDAGRMARASGAVVELDSARLAAYLPALAGAAQVLGVDPWRWVLAGGEDHGLLATFPPGTALPQGFRGVGEVRAPLPGESPAVTLDGEVLTARGWDHYRP